MSTTQKKIYQGSRKEYVDSKIGFVHAGISDEDRATYFKNGTLPAHISIGKMWWSNITIPSDQVPICKNCQEDDVRYWAEAEKAGDKGVENLTLLCCRHCLWHDYFARHWKESDREKIYLHNRNNSRGRSALHKK